MAYKVIGLGAGGHAKGIIEILRTRGVDELVGMLDPKEKLWGKSVMDIPVLGDDTLLPSLKGQGISHFFIGLGGSGDTGPRRHLYALALEHGLIPVDVIHPRSAVSSSAELGSGVTIMANAVINAATSIGADVIINTGAIVEHDCAIDDHVHLATGARLASTVTVGAGTHIGIGATVKQSIVIGEEAIVGAGAVVVKDVPPHAVVVGVPARVRKERE